MLKTPKPNRRALMGGLAALAAAPGGLAAAQGAGEAAATGPAAEIGLALRALLTRDQRALAAAFAVIGAYEGVDMAPSLIFALRYSPAPNGPIEEALARVTGETDRKGWFDWMLWQEAHPDVTPHPSYLDLKRDLFLSIDPNFEVFLKKEHLARDKMKIRLEEITWGGVRKDGIPSLDNPRMVDHTGSGYLRDDDLVFGVEINGDVRAYPLRIMGWHEMFNDVIGGVPVALAYCTLCGAGILFETDVEGYETPFIFGSSGFLYRSNKLMFDRQTHTLWNQFTGKPVSGELVDSDIELKQRPVTITTWKRWKDANPKTTVLSLNTGHIRNYGSGIVYKEYFASKDLMFPTQVDESKLAQKDYVFGVRTTGGAKAWPLNAFAGGRAINDKVGFLSLVLIGDASGRTVRAYDRGTRNFTRTPTGAIVSDGAEWRVTEAALVGPKGERAPRVAGHVSYWFAWNGYLGAESDYFSE